MLNKLPIGRIRIRTLIKAIIVFRASIAENEILAVDEIARELGCSRGNAYNYQRFLRHLLPAGPLRNTETREGNENV